MTEPQSRVRLLCNAGTAPLRRGPMLGVVAALVLLGVVGLPGQASAQPSSWVDGQVEQQGNQFLYTFEVINTTPWSQGDDDDDFPLVVDWELPLMVGPG